MINLFLLLLNMSMAANTQKLAYYMGGGGEPSGRSTIFDDSFESFTHIEKRGWETQYLFDGSHRDSKELLKSVGSKGQSFSNENAFKMLSEIEKILNDSSKNPAGILLFIDTHGGYENGKYLIFTDNGRIDILPQLERIKKLAAQRKIKLGIVGGTCFSGNLIPLADENTCVLSASPPDTIAYTNQINSLARVISNKSTTDLEDAHLKSRIDTYQMASQPMISTEEGIKAYNLLMPVRTHLLLGEYFVDSSSKQSENVKTTVENLNGISKEMTNEFFKNPLRFNTAELQKISKELSAFLKIHGKALTEAFKFECQVVKPKNRELNICYRTTESLYSQKMALYSEHRDLLTGQNPARLAELTELMKAVQMVEASQKFKDKISAETALPTKAKERMSELSNELGSTERSLYGNLYTYFKSKIKKSNACRDFRL